MIETNGVLTEKEPIFPPIKNEGTNGLSNVPRDHRDGTDGGSRLGHQPVLHQPRR